MIEKWEERAGYVDEFLHRLRGTTNFEYDIFELVDPAGKAGTESDIDGVILTKEVEKGGHFINERRKENGLSQLPFAFVDLVFAEGDKDGQNMENKISSSLIRDYIKANQ